MKNWLKGLALLLLTAPLIIIVAVVFIPLEAWKSFEDYRENGH